MRLGLLLAALFFAGSALALEPTGARFAYPNTAAALNTPEWRRDFLRVDREHNLSPGGGIACDDMLGRFFMPAALTENYLLNQADAATAIYAWYRSEPGSFEDAFREQHRRAAVGPFGDRYYYAYGNGAPYRSDEKFPGIFRADMKKPTVGGDVFQLSDEELALLERHGFKWKEKLKPHLPGVPSRFTRETLALKRNMFKRELPSVEADSYYRAETTRRFEEVRRLMHERDIRTMGDALPKALAQAYYMAVQWQPFDGINNSLFMAQVNVVLRHLGYRTMAHGRLDYLAFVTTPEVFERIFVEAFHAENPPSGK